MRKRLIYLEQRVDLKRNKMNKNSTGERIQKETNRDTSKAISKNL